MYGISYFYIFQLIEVQFNIHWLYSIHHELFIFISPVLISRDCYNKWVHISHLVASNNRNLFSHSLENQESKMNITEPESRCSQDHTTFAMFRGEFSVVWCFQLLVAARIPWLMTTSLQLLPPWSHYLFLFCVLSNLSVTLSYKDTGGCIYGLSNNPG